MSFHIRARGNLLDYVAGGQKKAIVISLSFAG